MALAISFDRIDQVPGPTLVNEHLDLGIHLQQGTGRARVVEVDVRQQHLPHVAHRYPLRAEGFDEPVERGRGTGVDQRHACGGLQDRRGDDARAPQKVQIDVVHAACEDAHVCRHENADSMVTLLRSWG